ncbi:GDSL-type esterase/lipase family protein [Streptomyces sp. NBC_00470]|uniref:GDSL-type esterase/lipase family protein n=1 Tax=Streptomyces sp. NBC_00470 TaxID=2975753 RepID=UPI002F90BE14
MTPLLIIMAVLAAAVLLTAVGILGQSWIAMLWVVRINKQTPHPRRPRTGVFHPAHPVEGERRTRVLWILGDSLGFGLGVTAAAKAPIHVLGQSLADSSHCTVRVFNYSRIGSGGRDLAGQQEDLMQSAERAGAQDPDWVVIVTGANDVVPVPSRTGAAARALGERVQDLTARGAHVVVATCPALGAVTALPRPARTFLHAAGLRLAARQEKEVHRGGGQVVALHREVSPAVEADPSLLSGDGFHPGDRGYRLATDKILARIAQPSLTAQDTHQVVPAGANSRAAAAS